MFIYLHIYIYTYLSIYICMYIHHIQICIYRYEEAAAADLFQRREQDLPDRDGRPGSEVTDSK